MKKQQKREKNNDQKIVVNDHLSEEVLSKLKNVSQVLKNDERKKQEEEIEKKRQERIQKEKNKSFADLLDESDLDWKTFK